MTENASSRNQNASSKNQNGISKNQTEKVNYKDLKTSKFQVIKEPEKKITYHLLYSKKPWTLKISSSTIRNNLVKSDDYHVAELNCSSAVAGVINDIDKYIINYVVKNSATLLGKEQDLVKIEDLYKDSVRYNNGSPYLKLRIDNTIKIYDKVGQTVNVEDKATLIKKDEKVGLLLRLENIRIGSGIIKSNWYIDQLKLSHIITDCEISDSESESDSDKDHENDDVEEDYY